MKIKNFKPIRALWIYEGASDVQNVFSRDPFSTIEH